MSVNPYQSPEIVAEPSAGDERRTARRWVAAPAIGIWMTGWIYLISGVAIIVFALVGLARVVQGLVFGGAPFTDFAHDLLMSGLGFLVMGLVATVLGGLAVSCAKRFQRLDSSNAAIAACLLGVIMYPMCFVTLPLGIFGLIVLRRGDVQRELLRNTIKQPEASKGSVDVDA